MKKLFIHIGTPKTGTSYVQNLYNVSSASMPNSRDLFYYPKSPQGSAISPGSGNGLDVIRRIKNKEYPEGIDLYFLSLFEEKNTVLLSSEVFCTLSDDEIEVLRDMVSRLGVQCQVIVFYRDLYEFCWSGYSQTVKRGGETQEFFDNAKERDLLLDSWQRFSVLGPVHVFQYRNAPGYLLSCFDELGLRPVSISQKIERSRVNKSLTLKQISLLRILNKYFSRKLVGLTGDVLSYCNNRSEKIYCKKTERLLVETYQGAIDDLNQRFGLDLKATFDKSAYFKHLRYYSFIQVFWQLLNPKFLYHFCRFVSSRVFFKFFQNER